MHLLKGKDKQTYRKTAESAPAWPSPEPPDSTIVLSAAPLLSSAPSRFFLKFSRVNRELFLPKQTSPCEFPKNKEPPSPTQHTGSGDC